MKVVLSDIYFAPLYGVYFAFGVLNIPFARVYIVCCSCFCLFLSLFFVFFLVGFTRSAELHLS